jgi:hypothetical protein
MRPYCAAKMQFAPEDCPRVKAECLRLLATLQLDRARSQLISGFVDTYLNLTETEAQMFQVEIGRLEAAEQEGVMEIVTSWMQQGMERGIEQGIQRERSLILRLLTRKVGELPEGLRSQLNGLSIAQVEALGEALLDFVSLSDLQVWLTEQE